MTDISDMSETYKIINGNYKLKSEDLFTRSETNLRGHSKKLFKPSSRIDFHKKFFTQKVITPWNKIPEEVVVAQDVDEFRTTLKRGSHP